ncbi:hypothetical protein ABZ117_32360, partial [Streptomyces sp. NPDC006309]
MLEGVVGEGVQEEVRGALGTDLSLARPVRDPGAEPGDAVEVIVTVAVNLMSAAAVKLGLSEEGESYKD